MGTYSFLSVHDVHIINAAGVSGDYQICADAGLRGFDDDNRNTPGRGLLHEPTNGVTKRNARN